MMNPESSQAQSVLTVEGQISLLDSLIRTISAHESLRAVGGPTSTLDVVEACLRLRPNSLLMDVCTDGEASGLTTCREVTTAVPVTRVILMITMSGSSFPEQARTAGAASFIYKDVSPMELTAIPLSTAGGYSTCPARPATSFPDCNELPDRKIVALREACVRYTWAEIVEKFGSSEDTIRSNIFSIPTKTGFRFITRLVLYAISSELTIADGADTTDEDGAIREGGAKTSDGIRSLGEVRYMDRARSADGVISSGGVGCRDEAQGEGTAP